MKKEILGVLVCMLFIVSVFPSSSFSLNNGPYVEITWPADQYESSESNIVVTGYASGELPLKEYGYIINYPGGGMFSEFWPINPPVEYYEFEISIDLIEGPEGNVITVYAKDTQDNQGTDSITVYYAPEEEDNEPPQVIITSPDDNEIFMDPEISLQGYVTDNVGIVIFTSYHIWGDEEYEIYSEIFIDPLSSYEFEFDVTLKPGINTLKVTAYDASDNKGEDIVEVTKDYECENRTPILSDNSGNTTFHGIFVGVNEAEGCENLTGAEITAQLFHDSCSGPGWSDENKILLKGDDATKEEINNIFDYMKEEAEPGDEFVFFFSGHGGFMNDGSSDEVGDINDACINLKNSWITDDELGDLISSFRKSVTITVILDCCFSGRMVDGSQDVQHAHYHENDWDDPWGDPGDYEYSDIDHISILTATTDQNTGQPQQSDDSVYETQFAWNDDGDGIIEPGEIGNRCIRGTDGHWYNDVDGDGIDNDDPQIDDDHVIWMTPWAKEQLEGLFPQQPPLYDRNLLFYEFTRADRNKDGITTSKELFEYSIYQIISKYSGDDDHDGLENEDNIDGIDNDGDGWIDEDWEPTKPYFFENSAPIEPNIPTGPNSGKKGEEYTYTTFTIEPENDDIFYLWDFGDGTYSEWLGPYKSNEICSVKHTWNEKGDYIIKVKARDRCFAESDWATLQVSMPKNKPIDTPFLNFLQEHPHLFPLLRQLLGL